MEPRYLVSLEKAHNYSVGQVGGKTLNLSICKKRGFTVPEGFCISTAGYRRFVRENKLGPYIDMQVMRKPYEDMRWEEIWDAALRIRSAFIQADIPKDLEGEIVKAVSRWPEDALFAIRSSAPEEDSKQFSFAGIHESYINVAGQDLLEKVKLVWASLWSDRSLLYKKERSLASQHSAMAVLVQKMEPRGVSGLAFTADPSTKNREYIIVEAIEGSLNLLVDNISSPQRYKIAKKTGEMVNTTGGKGILDAESVHLLYHQIIALENIFNEPVDIEWTGLKENFTVLQVRPITGMRDTNPARQWYLTLTPKGQKLIDLAEKVEKTLIPQLIKEGEKLSKLSPVNLSKADLALGLQERGESYERWLKIYWDEFIPFAHGIRHFGTFYNDLVQPEDPYQFIKLLQSQELLAHHRNRGLANLGWNLEHQPSTREKLRELLEGGWQGIELHKLLQSWEAGEGPEAFFAGTFLNFLKKEMDISYEGVRLEQVPEVSLQVILALSESKQEAQTILAPKARSKDYTEAYLAKAREKNKYQEAIQWLRIGRVSWKLRDDDNILMGKLENQLLVFMEAGLAVLAQEGRLSRVPKRINPAEWKKVVKALTGPDEVELSEPEEKSAITAIHPGKARQLLGQPSSPGLYTGKARVVRSLEDFQTIERGEVLVIDAVQPQMTFVIPLAGAIVERRGGMLVHSSIIAREMNIPAVNGVSRATELIHTGDLVTVNGDLGIVVLGKPALDMELQLAL